MPFPLLLPQSLPSRSRLVLPIKSINYHCLIHHPPTTNPCDPSISSMSKMLAQKEKPRLHPNLSDPVFSLQSTQSLLSAIESNSHHRKYDAGCLGVCPPVARCSDAAPVGLGAGPAARRSWRPGARPPLPADRRSFPSTRPCRRGLCLPESQPQQETMLMKWMTPDKPEEAYRFDILYVTVKLYGIPPNLISLALDNQILHEIGVPSYAQPMNEFMLFRDQESISARAKINVKAKAIDRVQFPLEDGSQITVYIHYEKINRICSYWAGFFCNVDDCPTRIALIHQQHQHSQEQARAPASRASGDK
ncbi:unnamed protein product [Urochloa humidicola]